MSDDIKLPTTVEEFQRALREAFRLGADWQYNVHPMGSDVGDEARRRYPIRRKVPRRIHVGLSSGVECYATTPDGGITVRFHNADASQDLRVTWLTNGDIAALADLLRNPYEEVDE